MSTETHPNLFIVGAQKAGTSALAGWLSQHPEVCLSFPKEPGYLAFGSDGYWFPDGYGKPAPASRYVVRDEASYLRLFAGASQRQHVIGEASTWYLVTPGMPEKLRAYSPGASIVVILRNPVERAYSAWCHARRDGVEPCASFADALAAEARRGEVEHLLRYRRMGLYAADLQRYLSVFPGKNLLVLFHDDLRAAPAELWRELDVPHLDLRDAFSGHDPGRLVVNASDDHPSAFAHGVASEAMGPFLERIVASTDPPP